MTAIISVKSGVLDRVILTAEFQSAAEAQNWVTKLESAIDIDMDFELCIESGELVSVRAWSKHKLLDVIDTIEKIEKVLD